jgi:phage portal protein BeeE
VCGGAYQYGSPLILDSLIESVDKLSLTPVEMDFLNSGMMTKARILQGFGVSPFSIGQVENGNRAAMMVAEKTFCANVLNPLGEMLSLSLTKHLLPMFSDPGERLVLWIEKFVAQDDEMDLKKWELGLRFGAVDRNEYRRVSMNLPEDPKFDGAPDPMSQMFRNSVNRPTDLGEVGTRTPDLIDTWQFDAAHNRVAARNGNGKV